MCPNRLTVAHQPAGLSLRPRSMNGTIKLLALAGAAMVVAAASFHVGTALALGLVIAAVAGFFAIAVIVGASVATRAPAGEQLETPAPSEGAVPNGPAIHKQ